MTSIFHVDMDAFFVSVEELFDPSLKGKPVVVGGRAGERGVVSAASYAARKFGVHSAMPLRQAQTLCPQAVFIEGHRERYSQLSHVVKEVLCRFSPLVEMVSIDEAYLDMTGTERLHGAPLAAAHKLHEQVKQETQLNCSIGAASSRLVAKVASDQAKPNGVLWILPTQEASFLAPLAVRKLPGVGSSTEAKLHSYGIRRVGDLARVDSAFLERHFGQSGLGLAGKAQGRDAGGWFNSPIGQEEQPRSISHEHTFSVDTSQRNVLEATLARMAEMVGRRLRSHNLHCRTVQLKLRYQGFETITRAVTLDHATQLDTELFRQASRLFSSNWSGKPVRLLGVQASSLEAQRGQLHLLDTEQEQRWERALTAADKLRDRFGEGSVGLANGLQGRFRRRVSDTEERKGGSTRPSVNFPSQDGSLERDP